MRKRLIEIVLLTTGFVAGSQTQNLIDHIIWGAGMDAMDVNFWRTVWLVVGFGTMLLGYLVLGPRLRGS